jgi:CHAT domain-containing protein
MKKLMSVLCLLALPAAVAGQEVPKVTKEDQKAADLLLNAFVKAGGLKVETDPKTKQRLLVVGDDKKLRELVQQRRHDFTPAVRNALVGGYRHPGVVTVLLAAGKETGDEQAQAFGRFFAAMIAEQQLRYREARQDYERAGKLFEGLKLPDWQATCLSSLAEVCRTQGDLLQARKLAQQALDFRRKLHGEKHRSVALSLHNLALICLDQGDLVQAHKLSQQALERTMQIQGERHPDVASCLNTLAEICWAQGDLPQARKVYQQALDLNRLLHGERHPNVAISLSGLGLVCRAQGDLPQARKLHQQAFRLFKDLYGARHPDVASSLGNLAVVYQDQGELAQARQLCQQALDLNRQLHGERHPNVAVSLRNLAEACRLQGDLPQARKLCRQALDLFQQLHGERHPDVATALNNLANVCLSQGDLKQARKLAEQALALHKQLHGERHPGVATALNNLAALYTVQSDLPRALRLSTEAVLACRLPGVDHEQWVALRPQHLTCDALTVRLLQGLGWLLQVSGNGNDAALAHQAATAYELAADLLDHLRSDVLDTEESKLFQGAQHAAVVPARVALAATLFRLEGKAEDLHAAFTALEQGRARVFLQALAQARSRQLGGVAATLLEQERDLLAYLRGLDASIQKENAKTLGQLNADLVKYLYAQRQQKEAELKKLVERMRREHPQYAALQYPRSCSLQQARDCLQTNEVAILFALDEKQSYAVVVQKTPPPGDKGQGIAVVPLRGAALLAGKVRTLVDREVLQSDSRTRQRGAELYELLLKPLAPYIAGKDLLLVPDGVLWEFPFELLIEGRTKDNDGTYLIKNRQIRYSPSLTVLYLIEQWEKTRPVPRETLWALADPVFSQDDPRAKGDLARPTRELLELYARRSGGGSDWQRLPGTRQEVEAIARLSGAKKEDVVLDGLASEKVLKTASERDVLSRKRYIHLATHGLLGSARGRPPSLVLSLVGNGGEEQGGGLNDGFLSFVEVTHLKLNADLVVLSACETGLGDLRPGEGVVGLSRAFLYAGSRGVVCSLWQVDDERTARLMQALYAELQKGKSSRDALTVAQRVLIADEEPPLFWAPFILIGK